MVMSWIFTGIVALSVLFAAHGRQMGQVSAATVQGAQSGVTLAISMAGAICLWSGIGKLMERSGITGWLTKRLLPVLKVLFPSTRQDSILAGHLSANICANLLGLGNAATPMGIQAAKRMAENSQRGWASNEMCRLIVLNTASIQLIPANVAAVRSALGCATPFDILPAVWLTSACSAGMGLLCAFFLGRIFRK